MLVIIAIARPDLIQTLVVRLNPQATQHQLNLDSTYTSDLVIDRPGVLLTQEALGQ